MDSLHLLFTGLSNGVAICPNCGSDHFESNHLDEALYKAAALEAPRLRFEGNTEDAIEVLTALYAIRIINFVRPQYRCLACGSAFDA